MNTTSSLLGHWRIDHMEMWEQDFVDAEVEGYVRFDEGGGGELHFGYVHGWMRCEEEDRGGRPAMEWSWEGQNEMEQASGRGWAVLREDGTLEGKLFFHCGDRSGFTATRIGGAEQHAARRMVALVRAGQHFVNMPVNVDLERHRRLREILRQHHSAAISLILKDSPASRRAGLGPAGGAGNPAGNEV